MKEVFGGVLALAALYLAGMAGLAVGFLVGRYTDIIPWKDRE